MQGHLPTRLNHLAVDDRLQPLLKRLAQLVYLGATGGASSPVVHQAPHGAGDPREGEAEAQGREGAELLAERTELAVGPHDPPRDVLALVQDVDAEDYPAGEQLACLNRHRHCFDPLGRAHTAVAIPPHLIGAPLPEQRHHDRGLLRLLCDGVVRGRTRHPDGMSRAKELPADVGQGFPEPALAGSGALTLNGVRSSHDSRGASVVNPGAHEPNNGQA
mmetsp:Transcript_94993/g.245398  ORF Transcript_94993/g.245398 Transcript_94993/m.245398 type:complete len:218 (+) Transcript_94993:568-1221(+)